MNSRYYDANIGRFINADGLLGEQGNALTHNMYAYTLNNPVMFTDPDGEFVLTLFLVSAIILEIIEVALVVTAAVGVAYVISEAIISTYDAIQDTSDAAAAVISHVYANKKLFEDESQTSMYTVYILLDESSGTVKYVGRTMNPIARQYVHKNTDGKRDLVMYIYQTGLTYQQARLIEQALISAFTIAATQNIIRGFAKTKVEGLFKYDMLSIWSGIPENELLNLMRS